MILEPGPIKSEWSGIATESLSETSGDGAYQTIAEATERLLSDAYSDKRAADPQVVARTILKAVTAGKPKSRYAVPFDAKLSIFVRGHFSANFF